MVQTVHFETKQDIKPRCSAPGNAHPAEDTLANRIAGANVLAWKAGAQTTVECVVPGMGL